MSTPSIGVRAWPILPGASKSAVPQMIAIVRRSARWRYHPPPANYLTASRNASTDLGVAIEPHEANLFGLLLNGTYLLQGFRNQDISRQLELKTKLDPVLRTKVSGCIIRLLRLLRNHGLIRNVSHRLYYRVTNLG